LALAPSRKQAQIKTDIRDVIVSNLR